MLRRIVVCLLIAVAAMTVAGSADARRGIRIDATPFSHAPCSVLSGRPCTPSYLQRAQSRTRAFPKSTIPMAKICSSRSKPCRRTTTPRNTRSPTTISTPSAICLRRCAPAGRRRRPTPRARACRCRCASVSSGPARSSAPPRVTYATAGASADIRATYLKAINASLDACMPLKFTGGLGGALAGRPIAIRYVDNRELKQ